MIDEKTLQNTLELHKRDTFGTQSSRGVVLVAKKDEHVHGPSDPLNPEATSSKENINPSTSVHPRKLQVNTS